MIEVERQFRPTQNQLEALLKDSTFMGEVLNKDKAWDYPDFRLFKAGVAIRNRNGLFELKVGKSTDARVEIENKEDIKKYFKVDDLEKFVQNELVVIIDYQTKRKKYKKDDFNIDVDKTDFEYEMVEIELMVESEDQIKSAENKIIDLAKKYGFDLKRIPSKRQEYFRLKKPEIYSVLYLNK